MKKTETKETRDDLHAILNLAEYYQDRFIAAEEFLMELALMPFWKRLFLYKKIRKFLKKSIKDETNL